MSSRHVLSQSGQFGLKIVIGYSKSEADGFSRQSALSTAVVVPARNTGQIYSCQHPRKPLSPDYATAVTAIRNLDTKYCPTLYQL